MVWCSCAANSLCACLSARDCLYILYIYIYILYIYVCIMSEHEIAHEGMGYADMLKGMCA